MILYPIPTTRSCTCADTYFDIGHTLVCSKCDRVCATCAGDPSNCLTCVVAQNRLQAPSCLCKPKFYDVPTQNECNPCSPQCVTCVTSQTNCLACELTNPLTNRNDNLPVCDCQFGYYEIGAQICPRKPIAPSNIIRID